MEVLKCYIDLTKDIRGDLTGLFITTTKPYRKVSKDTLSRWVKGMLKGAGIDMKIFFPHPLEVHQLVWPKVYICLFI